MSSAPNFSNNLAPSSLFGQQNSSPHFGGVPTTTPLFGPQSSNVSLFGRVPTTTPLFGPQRSNDSSFGRVHTNPLFGPQSSSVSPFGGVPSTTSLFGQQSSSVPVTNGRAAFFNGGYCASSFSGQQRPSFPGFTVPSTSTFGQQSSSFSGFGAFSTCHSDAARGGTSTPSLFGPQSSNAPVFSGASSAPSLSPFQYTTPQQQHPTFHGPTGIPSTSPFGPQSSSFSGFGGVASTPSPFGPQSSNAPVFSGASSAPSVSPFPYTDTTPQQQHTTFHGPTGIPTTSPFGPQSSSISSFGGVASTPSPFGRQSSNAPVFNGAPSTPSGFTFLHPFVTMTGNSNKGTRLTPYAPTPEGNDYGPCYVLTSISAVDAYNNKSHEELRLEDYKLQRIEGLNPATATSSSSSFAFHSSPFVTSNFALIQSSDSELKSSGSGTPPTDGTCYACSEFYKNQTPNVNVDPTAPQTSVANQTSSANINSTTPQTSAAANQTSSANVTNQTSSSAEASPVGSSFSPASVNSIISAFGAFGLNGGSLGVPSLNLVLGTTPVFVPTVVAFIPQQLPLVSAPPIPPSDVQTILRTDTAAAPAQPTSFVYSAAPVSSTRSTSIPKGLEIIVQTLGVNPWTGKDDRLDDFPSGKILACEDAATDPDIASLAEFAVEQHNAMDKDNKFKLSKVNVACLEAVDGGRYHIVLEAFKDPSQAIRFYAVVLRKKTDRPTHLIVLEKWLQGLVL